MCNLKKRIGTIFFVLVLLLPSLRMSAGTHPELIMHLGISGSPYVAGSYFTDGLKSSNNEYGTMSNLYGDYTGPVTTTGTFLAGLDIKFNRLIAVSVDLGINGVFADLYSGLTNQKTGTSTGIAVYLMPKAKLYYMDKKIVRLYGTLGLGVGKYFGYPSTSSSFFKNPIKCEVEFVPFGIEVGGKVFGFAELGVGTIFMGAHAGVGLKF